MLLAWTHCCHTPYFHWYFLHSKTHWSLVYWRSKNARWDVWHTLLRHDNITRLFSNHPTVAQENLDTHLVHIWAATYLGIDKNSICRQVVMHHLGVVQKLEPFAHLKQALLYLWRRAEYSIQQAPHSPNSYLQFIQIQAWRLAIRRVIVVALDEVRQGAHQRLGDKDDGAARLAHRLYYFQNRGMS